MPAVSKKQQRFFGMVRAAQKGEMKNPSKEVSDVASDISMKDAKKFAKTKHKGLPERKVTKEQNNPRIPRKKGQPANSKKHSDLYTDENPKGTIHGLGFKDVATAKASVSKIRNSSRSHAHKIQAAVAMEQRAREMGKTAEAAVYRKFINTMKKKTKKMNEETFLKESNFKDFMADAQAARDRLKKKVEDRKKKDAQYVDTRKKGVRFYDKKGSGRIKSGKKIYD